MKFESFCFRSKFKLTAAVTLTVLSSEIPCQLIVDVHEWSHDCLTVSSFDPVKM